MTIKDFRLMLEGEPKTWQWRTVEGDTGLYYTFADGTGIHFYRDDRRFHYKVATCEKFSICSEPEKTIEKLNGLFKDKVSDPTPEDPWRF